MTTLSPIPAVAARTRSIAAIYFTALLQGCLGVVFPASSAILKERLGLSDTLYGALFLPGLVLAFATSLSSRWLTRRTCLRRLFLFGLASQVAYAVLLAVAGSLDRTAGLPILVVALAVSGPAGGIMGIALNTAAIELFPATRSHALSAMHGLLGVGAVIAPLLVAAFDSLGFWQGAPLLIAAAVFATWLAVEQTTVGGLDEMPDRTAGPGRISRRLLARALTGFVYGASEAILTAWAVLFLVERHQAPLGIAAGALSSFWLAMTAGRLGGAAVLRWISPLRLALLLCLGASASCLLIAGSNGSAGAIFRFGCAGLFFSAVFPLLLGLASGEAPRQTPKVTAVFNAATLAGIGLGSFGVGPLRPALGLVRIYEFNAILPLIVAVLLVTLRRRAPRATRG